MRSYSFLQRAGNQGLHGPIQGVSAPPNRPGISASSDDSAKNGPIDAYSAAEIEDFTETNEGFTFAADMMKSQMRGTISDLKREPLKTP
jgi:hypothetical protein